MTKIKTILHQKNLKEREAQFTQMIVLQLHQSMFDNYNLMRKYQQNTVFNSVTTSQVAKTIYYILDSI